jgi:hypothetical protein
MGSKNKCTLSTTRLWLPEEKETLLQRRAKRRVVIM